MTHAVVGAGVGAGIGGTAGAGVDATAAAAWPMVVESRGHGQVELIDVRMLHDWLSKHPLTLTSSCSVGAGARVDVSTALLRAASTNGAQETLHG